MAVQQDDPPIEGDASCETKQPASDGKNAAEISPVTSPQVAASSLGDSNLPTVPSPATGE